MAVKWDGFTDEDIKKLKSKGNDPADTTRKEPSPLVIQKRATLSVAARRTCDKLLFASSSAVPAHHNPIPEQARLSTSHSRSKKEKNGCSTVTATAAAVAAAEAATVVAPAPAPVPVGAGVETAVNGTVTGEAFTPACSAIAAAPPFTLSRPRSLVSALMGPALTPPPLPPIDINDFEARQKMIEEQNRLKKVFLSKALEDRKKQASAEAKRLNMIQEELQKLDQRLSGDVSIIRNQIESASIEFLEAQKRYDRAEKEFLEAKMLFFTKLERKELLTHHLCTIIEQNEMRKAQKLSELMEKLDLRAEQLQENTSQDSEKPNTRKLSAEVILTPAEAGGTGIGTGTEIGTATGIETGTGIGTGTGTETGCSPPGSVASSSKETDAPVSLETSK